MNEVSNWNGVYRIEMKLDDSLVYDFTAESFAFNESRYLNAHLDYAEQVKNKSYYNRCYLMPGNQLSMYGKTEGIIPLSATKTKKVEIEVSDVEGNTARAVFWVKRKKEFPAPENQTFNYFLPYDEANRIESVALSLHFPEGSFYENVFLQYQASVDNSYNVYSSVHHIHNFKTPVHKYFNIGLKPIGLPEELRDKAFIAYCQKNGRMENLKMINRWIK